MTVLVVLWVLAVALPLALFLYVLACLALGTKGRKFRSRMGGPAPALGRCAALVNVDLRPGVPPAGRTRT